jgi:hypothetical protein
MIASLLRAPRLLSALTAGALSTLSACANYAPEPEGPQVLEVHSDTLVVGESLYLFGKNLKAEDEVVYQLEFTGTYTTDQGEVEEVNFTVRPLYDGEVDYNGQVYERLRLSRLGPFENPFSDSGRPGVFRGQIRAVIKDNINGEERVDLQPRSFELNVGHSVQILEFQPLSASCGEPAMRALPGIPYRLRVQSMGFNATRYEYQVGRVNGSEGITRYEHALEAPAPEDVVGDDEPLFFNPVPDDERFYVTNLRVIAYDDANNIVAETAWPLSVHRPIEVIYDGKRQLAEHYEPEPVSGCIPGTLGTRVSYSESKSEFRQRTVSVTVSSSWMRGHGQSLERNWSEGVSEGQSRSSSLGSEISEDEEISESMGLTYSQSTSNDVSFEESNGESWEWSLTEGQESSEFTEQMREVYGSGSWETTVSAETEAGIPFLAKSSVKGSVSAGVEVGARSGNTTGSSRGTSSSRGYSTSGSTETARSFGSSTTEGRSQSINNSYALSRSRGSSIDEESALESTRTWNLSEGVSNSETVSESEETAYENTIESSSEDSVTQSFSAVIPRGQMGIFYRQTTRWVRVAEVRSFNLCGVAQHVGDLQFNEYTWAPDLAVAPSCEEKPPAPNLPEASCFVPPCGG